MKQLTSILTLIVAIVCYGQEPMVKTMPLPFETGTNGVNTLGSRMTLEDETLYVPTTNGIWSINVNTTENGWISHGFEGENLMECIHKGDEWLAITRNSNMRLLLRSTDNGNTVEDYTPYELFPENKNRNVLRLCQDPANSDVIYLLSPYVGILKSTDFGKSWTLLREECNFNNTYCGFEIHPLNTDIILNNAENGALAPTIIISYNGGIDWISSNGYPTADIILPDHHAYMEDCIHDVAFHPTDINTWVYGGEGVIAKSTDQGRTWTHKAESWGYHYCTQFDIENNGTIYSVGVNNRDNSGFLFMLSNDCGETWKNVFQYMPETPWYSDMKQTKENLILLGKKDLHVISKKDLTNTSGVQDVNITDASNETGNLYSIDGVLIKSNVNRQDIPCLPNGIYIHNGMKIVVK